MTAMARLVARRLCHDMAGPIGAIATAVDLLGDDNDGEIRALIGDSARGLTASLRLYRYTLAPGDAQVATHDMRLALRDWLMVRENVILDWQITAAEHSAELAARVLGLSMIAAEALNRGGTLRISDDHIIANGPVIRLHEDVRMALIGHANSPSPAAALALLLMTDAQFPISLTESANELCLDFRVQSDA